MIFALCSITAAAGFAAAFEAGRVLERRILGVQKLGSIQFNQDGWTRQNTIVMLVLLTVIMGLEIFFLPRTMNPFVGTETLSKRSVILSAWSGILALGYGGLLAWMRALRNERKLFHLAKMEYERNRQLKQEEQTVEVSKHVKRAAAAGAAAVAIRQHYEKAFEELEKEKEELESKECDRGMYTHPSTSLAENERAWSEQLYQAMDVEAFAVAEKAISKRWKELEEWGVQIEEMRMRNKEQEEKIKSFRETREDRLKDQFDHFEGERERLVRLTQELEALKMDVEEYKEETRIKEEERLEAIQAKEDALQQRDMELQMREKDAFKYLHQPITLLISPPAPIHENGYEIQQMPTSESENEEKERDFMNVPEHEIVKEAPEDELVASASTDKSCRSIDEDDDDDLDGETENHQEAEIISIASTNDTAEKEEQPENEEQALPLEDCGEECFEAPVAQKSAEMTNDDEQSVEVAAESEDDDMMDSIHSRSDHDLENNNHMEVEVAEEEATEEEANDIASVAEQEDLSQNQPYNEECEPLTAEEEDAMPSIEDLVEIFKTGSASSHKRNGEISEQAANVTCSPAVEKSISEGEAKDDKNEASSSSRNSDTPSDEESSEPLSIEAPEERMCDVPTGSSDAGKMAQETVDPVPFVGDVAETISNSAFDVESIVQSALASLSLNLEAETSSMAESIRGFISGERLMTVGYDPLTAIPEESTESYSSIREKLIQELDADEQAAAAVETQKAEISIGKATEESASGCVPAPVNDETQTATECTKAEEGEATPEQPSLLTFEDAISAEEALTNDTAYDANTAENVTAEESEPLAQSSTNEIAATAPAAIDTPATVTCEEVEEEEEEEEAEEEDADPVIVTKATGESHQVTISSPSKEDFLSMRPPLFEYSATSGSSSDDFEDARHEASDHQRPDKNLILSFASATTVDADSDFEDAKDSSTSMRNQTSLFVDEENVEVVVKRVESI